MTAVRQTKLRPRRSQTAATKPAKPSSLLDTRVVYCGDNLEQLAKLPDACVDLIYIDPPFTTTKSFGAEPRRSAPLKTATRTGLALIWWTSVGVIV